MRAVPSGESSKSAHSSQTNLVTTSSGGSGALSYDLEADAAGAEIAFDLVHAGQGVSHRKRSHALRARDCQCAFLILRPDRGFGRLADSRTRRKLVQEFGYLREELLNPVLALGKMHPSVRFLEPSGRRTHRR